ncbi:GrpB family protein [Pseudomonas luteola]|uniref:GrpB family protein n=1 Tax=Pseudomonas luteola TaxID=47886 RepID=UPI00123A5436|nr:MULTISPECIES: GrpB family protein [Pseudomonas]MBA1245972.1 GrpB family protein [Pseudomonas zeshuii]QEU27401.1 GrpB family protein [Pseudomonas luteola]
MAIVVVSPYSHEWPKAFCAIREELLHVLSPCTMEIEHVGSTSVPGLAAKPVLDILVGARSLTAIESKVPDLVSAGYEYVARYERELPNRRYFVKSTGPLRVHVHAVEFGSAFWMEHLAFRNLLRSDSALRSAYQELKLSLAAQHPSDKSAYQAAKGPFIQSALAAAEVR